MERPGRSINNFAPGLVTREVTSCVVTRKVIVVVYAVVAPRVLNGVYLGTVLKLLSPGILTTGAGSLSLCSGIVFQAYLTVRIRPIGTVSGVVTVVPFPGGDPGVIAVVEFKARRVVSVVHYVVVSATPPA